MLPDKLLGVTRQVTRYGVDKHRHSNSNLVIALCLQYVLKGYPRKFLELLSGTPPHLTLNQVSYHSAESTEEIA